MLDLDGDHVVLGECKHQKGPVGVNVLQDLEAEVSLIEWRRSDRKQWFALFSVNKFTPELEELAAERGDVLLVL